MINNLLVSFGYETMQGLRLNTLQKICKWYLTSVVDEMKNKPQQVKSNTEIMPIMNNNGQAINQIIKEPVDDRTKFQCKGDFIRGYNSHIPRTALASSPGSGNTWTRHLLQQATGVSTGSIYGDALLQRNGFKDESKCVKSDTCLVVKTHEWKTDYQSYYDRAILILRHPRDSVVSSFHYFNGGLHVKEAKPHMFHTDHWIRFAEERIQFWFGLNNDWVTKFRNPLYIVFYEDLKANPISQIEKAVNFLNFTMTETDKICMEKKLQGNFQRKHNSKIDIDKLYTDSLKVVMDKRVQELTTAIQARFPGKSVIWTKR
ncbi:WSCD family member AGAP003962-like [Pecten maximus]|uniref:WSCD family member AGAP003962-like n=1 Tax=Pecten maximus TaxID=6579 RepID=UPI0014580C15|nr:WSCD family member AGAP003962-like [Pecten maximus]